MMLSGDEHYDDEITSGLLGPRQQPMSDYNGWRNYETWLVNLWLSSDTPEVYDEAIAEARYIVEMGHHPDTFRGYVEAYVFGEESAASLATDLIGAALSEVDWRAIVDALTEDYG